MLKSFIMLGFPWGIFLVHSKGLGAFVGELIDGAGVGVGRCVMMLSYLAMGSGCGSGSGSRSV